MKFQDLRETVRRSHRTDWHKITCWGSGSGPSYRDRLTSGTVNGEIIEYESHGNVAVFMPDIDISVAWGMDRDRDDRDLTFEWDGVFPDPKTSVHFADIFYRGSLVDREYLSHRRRRPRSAADRPHPVRRGESPPRERRTD